MGNNPVLRDTEGAVEDMRLAKSYLDDWLEKKDAPRSNLSFAAKYIEKARAKDPDAKLTILIKKDERVTYTQNELAADTLFFEAQLYLRTGAEKSELHRAREIIQKAIAYRPYSIVYRSKLADVYLDLHDKPNALAVAQEAVQRNPTDLDARKLLDRIGAAPLEHPASFTENNPWFVNAVASLMLAGGVVTTLMTMFGKAALESLSWFLLIGGGVLWLVGRSLQYKQFGRQMDADRARNSGR